MVKINALPNYLIQHALATPTKKFLHYKNNSSSNEYISYSYDNILNAVISTANSLKKIGVTANDKVAIFSFNRPEWVISDLAILSIQAVNLPIYPLLSALEIKNILNNAGAKIIIVENKTMLDTINSIKQLCPTLQQIVCINQISKANTDCISFTQLSNNLVSTADKQVFIDQLNKINSDHLASIVYTSGTTGKPKGVMLSHTNFIANITSVLDAITITQQDKVLSVLPLAHVFERTIGYYCILAVGGSIYYAGNVKTVKEDMLIAKPTIFIGVPLIYQKIHFSILDNITSIKKVFLWWALRVGTQYYIKNKKSWRLNIQHLIATKLIYSKVKAVFGNNLRFFVSGGAPLSNKDYNFFASIGLPIIEGYGLTETSPVICCNRLENHRCGSIGLVLKDQQIILAPDNELLTKGSNIMQGYYNDYDATAQAIDKDGWFHTGDIATIDKEGFVYLYDRKKEILVLSTGKNVSAAKIEIQLTANKYIQQAFVLGNKQAKVAAIVIPNMPALAAKFRIDQKIVHQYLKSAKIKGFFTKIITKQSKFLSSYEQVTLFTLLENPFTQEKGELTPTLKFKRRVIEQRYAKIIKKMYNKENY